MPVYEYRCADCKRHFEIKQSFNDTALTVCPNCGSRIHRVIQAAGIVFKGSGFYVTDSKSKQNLATSGEKKVGSESGEAKSGPASESAPTDSKPAAPATPAASA
jgi:putative FmdB family regulatory protein